MLNYDTMLTRLAAADVYPYNQAHDWEVKGPTVRLRYHMNDDILCTAATVARDYDALDANVIGVDRLVVLIGGLKANPAIGLTVERFQCRFLIVQ